ncbi:uracil-DNA glycosylase family protein, partial [Actinoplanes sp. NPDC024001]|uniref:uracil-DNA glycosylase family protein n=1 Tax=Actinoplanes sp. NPDC024001 TaxID=3154598 RepID=UPI0033D69620
STARLLHPRDQNLRPGLGLAIPTAAARPPPPPDELTADELVAGGKLLTDLVRRTAPRHIAVLGVTAYRTAFARPKARIGPQPETIAGVPVWVLPNPSGLNAHFQLADLSREFAALRSAVER